MMWQTAITYLIVAAAGAWVAWTVLLPQAWRSRLRRRVHNALGHAPQIEAGCDDCSCGKTD
jgi:hypothetical protein